MQNLNIKKAVDLELNILKIFSEYSKLIKSQQK